MNLNVTLFAQIIAFALLIWFVNKFLWGPITQMLAERQKRIADGLAAGEKGRHELEKAQITAKQTLEDAHRRAQEMIAQAQKRILAIEDESRQKAKKEAEQIKVGAKAEVEQELTRAKEQLRKKVAELTVSGASKILRKEVDMKSHSKMLDDLAAQL